MHESVKNTMPFAYMPCMGFSTGVHGVQSWRKYPGKNAMNGIDATNTVNASGITPSQHQRKYGSTGRNPSMEETVRYWGIGGMMNDELGKGRDGGNIVDNRESRNGLQ